MDFISTAENQMMGGLWTSTELWQNASVLCDDCQGRFAGSADERRAGAYLRERLKAYGLDNVAAEPFEMRGWQRGETRLTLLIGAQERDLTCLGLSGTAPCHLETEIIDVGQALAADFERLGSAVAGKIIVTSPEGPPRWERIQNALKADAAAMIFTGGEPGNLISLGSLKNDLSGVSLSYESTLALKRRMSAGVVKARLAVEGGPGKTTAYNISAELPGIKAGAGWIVAGGHYDGHDIAQGAQDNASGTVILLEAARLLAPFRDRLKVGLRFVFFSGEELGMNGSYAYVHDHAQELDHFKAMFNADITGLAMPLVLRMQNSPELAATLRRLPLDELDVVVEDDPKGFIYNSDHFPFCLYGIPALMACSSSPSWLKGWVHTAADTLEKLEAGSLRQAAGATARLLLRLAMDEGHFPGERKPADLVKKQVQAAGFEKALRFADRWIFKD